ncbi:hypothetical protein pb186bvf_001600 [Paramecium bursaria]
MKQVIVSQNNIHKKPITGISASKKDPSLFITISEDQTMRLFDLRVDSSVKLFLLGQDEQQTANCIFDDKVYGVKGDQILQFDMRNEIFNKEFTSIKLPAEINNIAKLNNNILANLDSGNSILLDDFTIKQQLIGHENICFTGDFADDIAFTAGFDCKIMAWNVKDGKIIKTTDLQKFHKNYTGVEMTPPLIYSLHTNKEDVLVSTETGHIYNFPIRELLKKKNKKQAEPNYVLDAHLGKVMRSIFFEKYVLSVSTDRTFQLWEDQVQKLKVEIPNKPNWIELLTQQIHYLFIKFDINLNSLQKKFLNFIDYQIFKTPSSYQQVFFFSFCKCFYSFLQFMIFNFSINYMLEKYMINILLRMNTNLFRSSISLIYFVLIELARVYYLIRIQIIQLIKLMFQQGDELDMNFIIENEGNDLVGKVPCDKSGVPLGISGVTVGNGYDIGQHSKDEVNRLTISPALKQKLIPYCNIKKQEAQEFLKKNPIVLTQQEAAELNKANLTSYIEKFKNIMNKYPEFYKSLTRSQKTVLFDFSYQQGLGKLDYFSQAFKENNKEKVLILLEQWTQMTKTKTQEQQTN